MQPLSGSLVLSADTGNALPSFQAGSLSWLLLEVWAKDAKIASAKLSQFGECDILEHWFPESSCALTLLSA